MLLLLLLLLPAGEGRSKPLFLPLLPQQQTATPHCCTLSPRTQQPQQQPLQHDPSCMQHPLQQQQQQQW